MRVITGGYPDLIHHIQSMINARDGLERTTDYDIGRDHEFQALAQIVYLISQGARCPTPSPSRIDRWLNDLANTAASEEHIQSVTSAISVLLTLARDPNLGAPLKRKKLAPFDLVMIVYLIHHCRQELSLIQLSNAIAKLREDVRTTHTEVLYGPTLYKQLTKSVATMTLRVQAEEGQNHPQRRKEKGLRRPTAEMFSRDDSSRESSARSDALCTSSASSSGDSSDTDEYLPSDADPTMAYSGSSSDLSSEEYLPDIPEPAGTGNVASPTPHSSSPIPFSELEAASLPFVPPLLESGPSPQISESSLEYPNHKEPLFLPCSDDGDDGDDEAGFGGYSSDHSYTLGYSSDTETRPPHISNGEGSASITNNALPRSTTPPIHMSDVRSMRTDGLEFETTPKDDASATTTLYSPGTTAPFVSDPSPLTNLEDFVIVSGVPGHRLALLARVAAAEPHDPAFESPFYRSPGRFLTPLAFRNADDLASARLARQTIAHGRGIRELSGMIPATLLEQNVSGSMRARVHPRESCSLAEMDSPPRKRVRMMENDFESSAPVASGSRVVFPTEELGQDI